HEVLSATIDVQATTRKAVTSEFLMIAMRIFRPPQPRQEPLMDVQNPSAPGLGKETIPEGEAEQIARIVAIHLDVTDPKEKPFVPRGQHMKAHGCVRAKIVVPSGLPDSLRHGVFAEPREFNAYIRYSNGKGRDDREGDAHGMAIKLVGVPGEKLL